MVDLPAPVAPTNNGFTRIYFEILPFKTSCFRHKKMYISKFYFFLRCGLFDGSVVGIALSSSIIPKTLSAPTNPRCIFLNLSAIWQSGRINILIKLDKCQNSSGVALWPLKALKPAIKVKPIKPKNKFYHGKNNENRKCFFQQSSFQIDINLVEFFKFCFLSLLKPEWSIPDNLSFWNCFGWSPSSFVCKCF